MGKITVKGVGSASVKPDYIVISLGVTERHYQYENALMGADMRVKLLQGAVETVGFSRDELKTLSFDTRTVYEPVENYQQRFAGYACGYRLKLAFDFDRRRLSETLAALAMCGANAEQTLNFTVKDPQKVNAELLKTATRNAREKAEILCEASGKKLGELLEISYNWSDIQLMSFSTYSVERNLGAVPAGITPEFEPDEIKTEDTATFVWNIE